MAKSIKIHMLHCGYMQVDASIPYGGGLKLRHGVKQVLAPEKRRVTLPVAAFLIEHPDALILVDTGWSREISPKGVYDPKAVERQLPKHIAALYHPWVPEGMAVQEQLAARGIRPEDLDIVLLTSLDPDRTSGLHQVRNAKRILVAEDEYFWNCRYVYQIRQPKDLFWDVPMEHYFYRGSAEGPNRWAYDLLGDGTILCVNVPGHSDGMCSVLVKNGELLEHRLKFALLTSDAAYSPKNWIDDVPIGLGFDRNAQQKGLQWLRDMAARESCVKLLTSHDPDEPPQTIELPMRDAAD